MAPALHQEYSDQMKRHGYGHAFYEPKSSSIVKPGSTGYLDEGGNWTPMLDLEDAVAYGRQGLTKPRPLERPPADSRRWGPKVSEGVRSMNFEATAGRSAQELGIPAEATATYKFSSSSDFGAVLMCSQPVQRETVYHPTRLLQWVKENARAILALYPDVQRHGFFLVTTTYHTTHAWINAWTSREKEVLVGFKARAVEVGEIAPSSQWYQSSHDSGWLSFDSEVCLPTLLTQLDLVNKQKRDDGKVVFFGAIHFMPRTIPLPGRLLKVVQQDHWRTFRDGHEKELDFAVESPIADTECQVECRIVGDLSMDDDEELADEEEYF
ncbi:hypothetical protein LTR62_001333 [Meristemomyces frigidus]|uniref:Uncharacterized protein n=1 Tax=Meristemomyces frigidus TaxID=1508187 RepID=A0AAN7TBI1_9PEZI|nr:hypothetical protein LTR62_001333 [Meristemomyces frigidus]